MDARSLPTLPALLVPLALAAACPPNWESLPYPDAGPSEGEGEGVGEVCAGVHDEQGLESMDSGIGHIADMIDDGGDTLFATDTGGVVARVSVSGGGAQVLGRCGDAFGEGQLMRASSGVLIRTGNNALCAVAEGVATNVQQVLVKPPAELLVAGAILEDGDPATVLVAYAEDPDGGVVSFARFEVAGNGDIGAMEPSEALPVTWPVARLERIGGENRVAVAVASGEIVEATLGESGELVLTARGQLPNAGGAAFLAFGPPTAEGTPVVVAHHSNNPQEKVWTGLWEQGASSWLSVPRSAAFDMAAADEPDGLLMTSLGCVVHYGTYGYVGVQSARDRAMEPASLAFRAKDVQRLARGPNDTLWALTTLGGLARWRGDEQFCADAVAPPENVKVIEGGVPSAVLVPVTEASAVVGLYDGLVRVDFPDGSIDGAFEGRSVAAVLVGNDDDEAVVVFGSGVAHRVQLSTLTPLGADVALGATPAGSDGYELDAIAAAFDPIVSDETQNVFWVAAFDGTERRVMRCSWQDGLDPLCDAPETFAGGSADPGEHGERVGAITVVGDALAVLLATGVRVALLDPGHNAVTSSSWTTADIPPPAGSEDYFTSSSLPPEILSVGGSCAVIAGYGPRMQSLLLEPGIVGMSDAEGEDRDPFLTALTTMCDGSLLAAGGLGSTFYRVEPDAASCTATSVSVLGPARPNDRLGAGAQADGRVWVAEGSTLWQLPAP